MEQNNNGHGGLGGQVQPANGARDTRMMERAVREGWDIPPAALKALPAQMIEIAIKRKTDGKPAYSPRNRIAATRVLVAMHGQNQDDDPAEQKHVHTGTIELQAVRQELLSDEQYLDYCRQRAIDVDSGPVRTNGEQRSVANGKASNGTRPGTNGTSNGTH